MDLNVEIKEISTKLKKQIKNVEDELLRIPDGRLTQETHQGKPTLVIENIVDGRRIRHSVTREDPAVQHYLRKIILTERLKVLQNNERILSRSISGLNEPGTLSLLPKLMKKFSLIPETQLLQAFEPRRDPDDWASRPYEQSDYMPEGKKQITSRGLRVRSKSEVLLVEMLYDYELPPRYEQVLHFGSVTIIPDFIIRRADGKIFYWEHMGLTYSKEYRDHQMWKLQTYINNGITPWDNLIITFDNSQGNIDTRIIRSEIENKLLVFN